LSEFLHERKGSVLGRDQVNITIPDWLNPVLGKQVPDRSLKLNVVFQQLLHVTCSHKGILENHGTVLQSKQPNGSPLSRESRTRSILNLPGL
jgi:hypothetical protein